MEDDKYGFNPARFDFFASLTEDEKLKLDYTKFTISEINTIIAETPMKDIEKKMALMRYNKRMTLQEIADALQIDIKTVKRNMPIVSLQLKLTCAKMFVK